MLRTENVIMHGPHPNPFIHPSFRSLSCLSLCGFSSICLSLLPSVTYPPTLPPPSPDPSQPLSVLSFNHVMTAIAFLNCSAAASAVPLSPHSPLHCNTTALAHSRSANRFKSRKQSMTNQHGHVCTKPTREILHANVICCPSKFPNFIHNY